MKLREQFENETGTLATIDSAFSKRYTLWLEKREYKKRAVTASAVDAIVIGRKHG